MSKNNRGNAGQNAKEKDADSQNKARYRFAARCCLSYWHRGELGTRDTCIPLRQSIYSASAAEAGGVINRRSTLGTKSHDTSVDLTDFTQPLSASTKKTHEWCSIAK